MKTVTSNIPRHTMIMYALSAIFAILLFSLSLFGQGTSGRAFCSRDVPVSPVSLQLLGCTSGC